MTTGEPFDWDAIKAAYATIGASAFFGPDETPYEPVGILNARKISAYMEVPLELIEPWTDEQRAAYAAAYPKPGWWKRLLTWRSDKAWSIRHRLATRLLGYDPEDN